MITVDVFTLGYNEEKILPHFINHYKQFCRNITFYNNCCTDNSIDICKANGVNVIDTGIDEFNDIANANIKELSYKNSDADFCIVVDTDEFVFHPDLLKLLEIYKTQGVTLPKVRGYTMATDKGYPSEGLLIDSVKTGIVSRQYAKRCIFSPKLNIRWSAGQHAIISCQGPLKESEQEDISILHYKFVDYDEYKHKCEAYSRRLSRENIKHNLSGHYLNGTNESWVKNQFEGHVSSSIKLI